MTIPEGICQCGCGGKTGVPRITNNKMNRIAGVPMRFIVGHNRSRLAHGQARKGQRAPEYNSYRAAKARCENLHNNRYPKYGGAGVKFLFDSFEHFFTVMGERPEPKHKYSLDRWPNPEGNYEPGNLRWASAKQQSRNTKRFRFDEAAVKDIQALRTAGMTYTEIAQQHKTTVSQVGRCLHKSVA
jgi:hypothetical protein